MEHDEDGNDASLLKLLNDSEERPRSAVNSVVLDYYKKFGRKRDLEQYFSLSTAQSDIRDPRSLFWRRMKDQSDTSDSGEKKSESSNEICRISIKCSIPGGSEAEVGDLQSKTDTESPPIITDVLPGPLPSGDESIDDNHSQKSADATLDTSINKPLSPTSSITSQRKLEWDSLADVGYGNESDRKTSASSLSTLEREVLAQKQQYTLDYKPTSDLGLPTAHSTPLDPSDSKLKGKKGQDKKTISFSRKDVDFVEVSVPHDNENARPINVHLTKQFSVNLQKDGGMTVDNVKRDINITPEKNIVDPNINTGEKFDKEIQTSLLRSKAKDQSPVDCSGGASTSMQRTPILICFNNLKRMQRRKKLRKTKTKPKSKKITIAKKAIVQEKDKSGEQVSEAESFEYMPGHVYNQNKLKHDPNRPNNNNNNNEGNKSSLESSAVHTTDSSKESKYSFSKDLDHTLNVLKSALNEKYDSNVKKKLVTEIIQRLLKSNYGNSEGTPVLSSSSKKTPTTSTSEADNTEENVLHSKPKKSILRVNKFEPNNVASTSQSAPNLPSVVNSDKLVKSYLSKTASSTTTETDMSNNSAKDVTSSDTIFTKKSSEELYKKYVDALKREEAYKQYLRDKESFLKQKLTRSDTALKMPTRLDVRTNAKLKELIKDLTRNNYDDGSGDASKLEGGSSSNFDINRHRAPRKQRSHSVFTLSSGNSDIQHRSCNLKNKLQKDMVGSPTAGPSNCYTSSSCNKPSVTDSSVQVNQEEEKYICLCPDEVMTCNHQPYSGSRSAPINNCTPVFGPNSGSSSLKDGKKHKTILECTRCLQTKISINPNIADPSVTDLNIIQSAECVQLINELYRKVSQTNSEYPCSNEKDDSTSITCQSSKDNIRFCDKYELYNLYAEENKMAPLTNQQTTMENVIQDCIGCQKTLTNQPENLSDNIVIPIKGTNMMLKVSIGGKTMMTKDKQTAKLETDCIPMVDREVNTDKLKTCLKGTSILEECSKSVQAENQSSSVKHTTAVSPRKSPCNTDMGFNTYPKSVKIMDKKPFIRSNTGFGTNFAVQTDNIYIKDEETQPCCLVDKTIAKQSKHKNSCETSSQTIKKTPSEPNVAESSKSSYGDSSENRTVFKNKYSHERQNLKDISCDIVTNKRNTQDNILDVIKDITKRYSKEDIDKRNKKKCYKEILTALHFLLDTDDSGDGDEQFTKKSSDTQEAQSSQSELIANLILDDAEKKNRSVDQKNECCSKTIGDAKSDLRPQQVPLKSTCDKGCGCDGTSECNDCNGSSDISCQNAHINNTPSTFGKETLKHETYLNQNQTKTMCDMGCGSDGSSGYNDCGNSGSVKCDKSLCCKDSAQAKIIQAKCNSPKKTTCDKGCGNDGTSDCNDCGDSRSVKCGTSSTSKKSARANKIQERFNSPKRKKTTRYSGCGHDGSSECKECVQPHSPKCGTSTKKVGCNESAGSKLLEAGCNSPKKKITCNKMCGCDGSSECKECVKPHAPKNVTGSCARSKKPESRCSSPNKTKITCDIGCGTISSDDCKCVKPHSSQYRTGQCGKESSNTRKQEERTCSPNKAKTTCDRACGCDGSPECSNCTAVEPQSICKNHERYSKTNFEKTCRCDGNPECKDCNRKSAFCGKKSLQCKPQEPSCNSPKRFVNRCMQSTVKRVKSLYSHCDDSSDIPCSTDLPCCSTDSPAAKFVNKIKKECNKYQKRCKSSCKKCEASSSTAVSCDHCRRARQCYCRWHRCRCHKARSTEKVKKKCIAYNLIVQTSDSVVSEETVFDQCRPLQNVIVRVPKCKQASIPFKEVCAKIEQKMPPCGASFEPKCRAQSWANECGMSSTDDVKIAKACTVRDYLEKNRPDIVDKCDTRQSCLRTINETRAKERSRLRQQLVGLESTPSLNDEELIYLAKEFGLGRRRPLQQNIISEREMKKHSEKIYKTLPEVKQKKEDAKKEKIKKTNLLLANIFKRNLQKKTLKGDVNISNYSQIVKI